MVFVHGGAGSGAQFQAHAMRFTGNGYPARYIAVHEYDSTLSLNTYAQIYDALDVTIAALMKETGADKVDLLGHSMGTYVLQGYLAFPERAARVARYVNIDGRTAAALPGGVPTLALWAGVGWTYVPGNEIVGATNVLIPGQTHVEVATSSESFAHIFKFFTGRDPWTTEVVMEPPGLVRLAGRVVIFPLNIGADGATLEVWEVSGETGARRGKKPDAVYRLDNTGHWGPFKAKGGAHYEFNVVRDGMEPHHFYYEPFVRSNYWMRQLVSSPTYGGSAAQMERSDVHSNLVISRNKEFWGDQGAANDILTLNGINIINAATSPVIKGAYRTGVIGIYAYDRFADGVSDLSAAIPSFYAVAFMTGVDVVIPAASPVNATTQAVLMSRGGCGAMQVINFPNWASSTDRVTIQFHDYVDSRCEMTWRSYQQPGKYFR
ncbi:MAG: hypothetical protein R6W75_07100 [Smithellaceae bacterium]